MMFIHQEVNMDIDSFIEYITKEIEKTNIDAIRGKLPECNQELDIIITMLQHE